MPFAAPLNWPMTLTCATLTLLLLLTSTWWLQLPTLPHLKFSHSTSPTIWHW